MPTRREFQIGAGAALLGLGLPLPALAQKKDETKILTATTGKAQLLEGSDPPTDIWGYEGRVPGPLLRLTQGERLSAKLVNKLTQPTTIHWHGIRNINAMDGVAGLTQEAVKPGETFDYRFAPPDAGTYWYHPHNRSWEQVARGLYGVLIVDEEMPPKVDQDLVFVFDDWRIDKDGSLHEASFGAMHDISHGGRLGNVLTLNGMPTQDFAVKAGERLRIRLINSANARIIGISFEGHAPKVIALDGMPVEPFAPKKNMVVLTPAQRADLILDCDQDAGARGRIIVDVGREQLHLGDLIYDAKARAREKVLGDAIQLAANPLPTDLDEGNAVKVDLVMTGGAMSAFAGARYKGKDYEVRDLVREHRKAWAFNGTAGMPEKPLGVFDMGKSVQVRMVNKTAWPHAMHFHGHHVLEVAHSARAPLPYWRDTVLMDPDDEITVAFKAHNPGKWMLHCHMLEHQAGGMATWYEVG